MKRWSLSLIKPWGLSRPDAEREESGDDLVHIFCYCDRNVGLCGTDLSGHPECANEPFENECVVCLDLDDFGCPRCGL